jgi:hypothetical protein
MTQVVIIGRRTVNYEKFINTVKESKRYSEVCDRLGFNSTVTTTIASIKAKIEEMGLNTSHFEYKYTKSDKCVASNNSKVKVFSIMPVNQCYYNSMEKEFESKQTSFNTYKPNIGAYLESIGNKDFATVTVTDIENYVNNKDGSESTKKNCMAHIRSMMINAVKNNVNCAVDKVNKDMLIWLI